MVPASGRWAGGRWGAEGCHAQSGPCSTLCMSVQTQGSRTAEPLPSEWDSVHGDIFLPCGDALGAQNPNRLGVTGGTLKSTQPEFSACLLYFCEL